MSEVFLVVHGEPLQAALPGTSVHDRSGRSGGIRPRCLHRCLHLVPPILKAAFAWHRPKESNGCLFTRSAHTTSAPTQERSPWRPERSHQTTIWLGPSSTRIDGQGVLRVVNIRTVRFVTAGLLVVLAGFAGWQALR